MIDILIQYLLNNPVDNNRAEKAFEIANTLANDKEICDHFNIKTYYDEFEDIPFDYLTKLYLESYPKLCSVGNQHSFDFYKNIQ